MSDESAGTGCTPSIPPFIDWMSRHGLKLFLALVLIELAFHGWAIRESKRRDEPYRPSSSVARDSQPAS